MSFFRFIALFIALSFFSCSEVIQEFACYHFDQRQCQTDEFGADIASADQSEWAGIIKEYLESKAIVVTEVKVNFDYYESVCEACDVCPEVHRFYVKISILSAVDIEALNLMNLDVDNCKEFF